MKPQPYILIVAGTLASVFGIIAGIPAYLKGDDLIAVLATILVVGGLVFLAIGLGREHP